MAFLPCVIEEMAYRGIILGSFREGGRLKAIIASGLLFGIMHMNFNQMAYAIVIGIIFGIVIEATGSIVSTMIMHFMINGLSVTLSYVSSHIPALSKQLEETTVTRAELITTIEVYLPMTVVGTAFAVALIFLLAVVNDRKDNLISLFHREEPPYDQQTGRKIRIFTPLLIAIIIICLGICAYEEFVLY
jgi:membrane protease YdiL (CAAX protease family)